MEIKGRLKNFYQNIVDDCFEVVFQIGRPSEELQGLVNKDLRITMKKWSEKRSLDANSYAWVLCSKIAEKLSEEFPTSKDDVYNRFILEYGFPDEPAIAITVKSYVDITKVAGHWKKIKENDDYCGYLRIRGSSEYDRREMAHFIDALVTEAKELGIEVLPPDELERMVNEVSTTG